MKHNIQGDAMGSVMIVSIVVMLIVMFFSWSNSVDAKQLEYKATKSKYTVSNRTDINRNELSNNSDKIKILEYKLQNAEYREKLMLLGLWYFGYSDIWKLQHTTVDPEKLAGVIETHMPWVVDTISYNTIDDYSLNTGMINQELQPVITKRFSNIQSNDINDIINKLDNSVVAVNAYNINNQYDTSDYSDRRQPDSFLNNDRSEYFSDHDPSTHQEHYDDHDYDYPEDDSNYGINQLDDSDFNVETVEPNPSLDFHVEHDQNFFPFLNAQ